MLDRDTWQRMERRIRELPAPERVGNEQPRWAIPSDGLPTIQRHTLFMKIVREFPSGWNGYPVWVSVNLDALRFTMTTKDDALLAALRSAI